MKLLFIYQGYKLDDQISYYEAFRGLSPDGDPLEVEAIPWLGVARTNGWNALWQTIIEVACAFRPDIVFFEFFHTFGKVESPAECIRQLREKVRSATGFPPLIFGSLGDLYCRGFIVRRTPCQAMYELAQHADAYFMTSMGELAQDFKRHGARNIVFLPHAFSTTIFNLREEFELKSNPHTVLICGSGTFSIKRPGFTGKNMLQRRFIAHKLWKSFGSDLKIYGHGWGTHPAAKGGVPFQEQVELFKTADVVVDSKAAYDEEYYLSDRPFFVLGSGTPLVLFHTPRIEKMMRGGSHAHCVYRMRDVAKVCKQVLTLDEERRMANCRASIELVKEHHLFSHRADTILSVAQALWAVRSGICEPELGVSMIRMHHFLPEVDLTEERKHAIVNWIG